MNSLENQPSQVFRKAEKLPADYFTGSAWLTTLVPNEQTLHTQIGSVIFEAGARNNWHMHPGGQILIVTDGIGYYQEKGKSIQSIRKGDVVTIAPDVEHWHGASQDHEMTHLAINTNTQKGIVIWLARVTDDEYNNFK